MICRSGKRQYKLPDFSQIQSVLLDGNQKHNSYAFRLNQISIEEFKSCKLYSARPTVFAVNDNIIYFWPCPDKPYSITIRYFPPLREF